MLKWIFNKWIVLFLSVWFRLCWVDVEFQENVMVCGVNKVILVGNVGGDLEICYMFNGNVVINIIFVISESWKDKQIGQ